MDEQAIIQLAKEAGIYYRDDYEFCEIDRDGVPMEMMAKFAALVAAAERDRMIAEGYRQCAEGQHTTQYCGLLEAAVKAEREACALIADEEFGSTLMIGDAQPKHSSAWRIAAAIRARGNG
jgi:hypothetical protein